MSMIGLIREHQLTPEKVAQMALTAGKKTWTCESCKSRCKSHVSGFSLFGCCKSCFDALPGEVKRVQEHDNR